MSKPTFVSHFSSLLFAALAAIGLAACGSLPQSTAPDTRTIPTISLRLIGEKTIPHRAELAGTTFGGISGMDYDEARDLFYLLSDDRSQNGPARFYTAKIAVSATELGAPQILSAVSIKKADGGLPGDAKSDPVNVLDPEAIRYRKATDTLLWTSEGDKRLGLSPFVREMRRDGSFVRELPTLPMFMMRDGERGPRDNTTFEAMSFSPDQATIWVAMEGPLYEDGATPNPQAGAPIRITQYETATGKALRQFAYNLDALPHRPMPPTGFADNGAPEILMLDEHRMLVLERSFAQGIGNSIRIYWVDTRDGGDTLNLPSLNGSNVRIAQKRLVLNFDSLNLLRLDNTEAMSFGPRLPNGNRTLLVASDDNFNRNQINQFLAFEVLVK